MTNEETEVDYIGVPGRILFLPLGTERIRDIEGKLWRVERSSYIGWRGRDHHTIVEELKDE